MEKDCREIPNVGGVMESVEKRNRSANWTDLEMKALLEEVEPRRNFLKCKKTDVASMKVKIKQWEEIEIAMTSKVPQFSRSAKIISDKWSSMKKVARKWASAEKRRCAGGGFGGALMSGKPWWVECVLKFLKTTDVHCHSRSDGDQNSNLTIEEDCTRSDVQGEQENVSENDADLRNSAGNLRMPDDEDFGRCDSIRVSLMPLPPELSQIPPLSPVVAAPAPLCSSPTPATSPTLPIPTAVAPSSLPTATDLPVRSSFTSLQRRPPPPPPPQSLMPLPPELSQFPPLSPVVAAVAPLCSSPTPATSPTLPIPTAVAPSSVPTAANLPIPSSFTSLQHLPLLPPPLRNSRTQTHRQRHKVDTLSQNFEELTDFKRRYYAMKNKLLEQDKKLLDLKLKWALEDRENELNNRERRLQWEIEERNLKLRREEEIHSAKLKALRCECRCKKKN